MVELTNVPPELRSGNVGPMKEDTKKKEMGEKVRNHSKIFSILLSIVKGYQFTVENL